MQRRVALHALVSCPTGSIGNLGDDDPKTPSTYLVQEQTLNPDHAGRTLNSKEPSVAWPECWSNRFGPNILMPRFL